MTNYVNPFPTSAPIAHQHSGDVVCNTGTILITPGAVPPLTASVTAGRLPPGISIEGLADGTGVLINGSTSFSGVSAPIWIEVADSGTPPTLYPFSVQISPVAS